MPALCVPADLSLREFYRLRKAIRLTPVLINDRETLMKTLQGLSKRCRQIMLDYFYGSETERQNIQAQIDALPKPKA